MAQLAGGEPLSLEYLIRSAPTVLPFGLRNAAETDGHLVAQRTPPSPTNDGFVRMTEYVAESFPDLLSRESESPSNSDSSRGSHHPSHECFMVGTPEGHIKSIHEEEATPTNDLDDKVCRNVGAPPRLWVEQLKAHTKSSRKHGTSSSRNARSSSERSSAMETVGMRAPWPTT